MDNKPRLRKHIKTVLKLCVSVFALVFVFTKIDFAGTWQTMRGASPWWLLASVGIYVASQLVSSERVRMMLAALPVRIGWWSNMKLYWLGMFYNFFLPGGVGGDGYKVYWLRKRHNAGVKPVVLTLIGDRISGLAAICIYVVVYAAFRAGLAERVGFEGSTAQHYLLILPPIGLWCYWLFFRLLQRRLVRASFRALALSLIIQGLQMTAAVAILQALHVDEGWGDYLFLFLLSSIASAVPVTLGGVGARELTFMIGSDYLSIDQNTAISLSLLFYAVSLASSLPGLILVMRSDLIEGAPILSPAATPHFDEVIDAVHDQYEKQSIAETDDGPHKIEQT